MKEDNKLIKLIRKHLKELEKELLKILKKFPERDQHSDFQLHFMDLHLALEQTIEQYIITFMGEKFNLKDMGLTFARKIHLARGIKHLFYFDNIFGGVIRINKIRNEIAHNLGRVLTEEDVDSIWSTLEVSKFIDKVEKLKVNGKTPEEFTAHEKILFLKLSFPLLIAGYTKIMAEYEKMKKHLLGKEDVLALIKSEVLKDLDSVQKS